MIMEIVTGVDTPILRTRCDEVSNFDKNLLKLVADMKSTMKAAKGLGIAAPQVNINARVAIITLGFGSKEAKVLAVINPEILHFSEEQIIGEEGCLSIPGVYGNVSRSKEVTVRYSDEKGEEITLHLLDMDARVVQHEVDHLNGVLFVDKLVEPIKM